MIKAALIGCGKIGSSFADDPKVVGVYAHAHAYAECEGVKLVGVCDADEQTALQCGRRWQISAVYTDYVRMLQELRPDIVSVCTPDDSHFEVLHAVLQADSIKGILAEKPLVASLDDAEQIVALADARNVKLAVNYSRRYALSHQKLREQLPARLGVIQSVNGFYTKGLLHNGTHWLDLLRFLCGPVQLLDCYPGMSPFVGDPPGDASPGVVLQLASGAPATLTGLDAAYFSLFEMDIVGSRGRVRLLDSGYRFEWCSVADSPYFSGYRVLVNELVETAGLRDATLYALQDLLAAIEQQRQPLCNGEDALAAQRLVSQARACVVA